MTVFGIDGCKGGWFYIGLGSDKTTFGITKSIEVLIEQQGAAARYYIDIPIGLIDEGAERRCDAEGRKLLGPGRGSSVFPSPTRAAVYSDTYTEASALNHAATGRKLSKQSWAIVPKIREIDELLLKNPEFRSRIREVHPEILFYGLANNQPMKWSKRTPEGFMERMDLLEACHPGAKSLFQEIREFTKPSVVAADDILDAMAAAVSARSIEFELITIPQEPTLDSRSLPMEMVYPKSHRK